MGGPQLAALSDEFTVVAWDEPVAGRSSDLSGGFGLTGYAYCLAELIEALDLSQSISPASHGVGLSRKSRTATVPSSSPP
jgi:pimeloyl-ACP methyl ester carboxylesterase